MRTRLPGSSIAMVGCVAAMLCMPACGNDASGTGDASSVEPAAAEDWPPLPLPPADGPTPAITVQLRPAAAAHGASPLVGTFDVRIAFAAEVPAEHVTWPSIQAGDGGLLPDGLYFFGANASLEATLERGAVLSPGDTFHSQLHIARLSAAAPESSRIRMDLGTSDQAGSRASFPSEPVELRFEPTPRLMGVSDLADDWPAESVLAYWHTTPGSPVDPRAVWRSTALEVWADGTAVARERTHKGFEKPVRKQRQRRLTPDERAALLAALRAAVGPAPAADEPAKRTGQEGGIHLFLASGDAAGLYELPDGNVDAAPKWKALRAQIASLVEAITDE